MTTSRKPFAFGLRYPDGAKGVLLNRENPENYRTPNHGTPVLVELFEDEDEGGGALSHYHGRCPRCGTDLDRYAGDDDCPACSTGYTA